MIYNYSRCSNNHILKMFDNVSAGLFQIIRNAKVVCSVADDKIPGGRETFQGVPDMPDSFPG